MRVDLLTETSDLARWDAYVAARAATVTDLVAWARVVEQTYGIASYFIAAQDGDRIIGTLAVHEIRHPIFGRYLTTAVFGTDGGLHFDDESVRDALIDRARALAHAREVDYLIIRTRGQPLDGALVDERYCTSMLDLDGGADAFWKRLPGKTRNQVRRGLGEGLTLDIGHDQRGAFFDVFHRHMRDLGSPAHAAAFYDGIVDSLGDRAQFYVVRDGSELAAGALLFRVNGTAMNLHTVSLRKFNRRCANHLVYWRMIEDSANAGCRWFDMGRSEHGSSQMDFKRNWNPLEVPLKYNYFLVRARALPRLDPRNPKYRMIVAAWKRMPLFVTRSVGPRLISGLA